MEMYYYFYEYSYYFNKSGVYNKKYWMFKYEQESDAADNNMQILFKFVIIGQHVLNSSTI